jgi:hypothetical protein
VAGTITGVSVLNVDLYGPVDGPPVLALHGGTGHCLRWRPPAAGLPDVRLVTVDLRGHGRSPSRPAIPPPADLPTLLPTATKEAYVHPDWVAHLGPLTTVQESDTGHVVYLERAAEVATAIRAFPW